MDHVFDSGVDASIDRVGFPIQADEDAIAAGVAGVPLLLVMGEGCAGEPENLERTDGAADVVWMDTSGGGGVGRLEFGASFAWVHGGEPFTESGVGFGAVEETVE